MTERRVAAWPWSLSAGWPTAGSLASRGWCERNKGARQYVQTGISQVDFMFLNKDIITSCAFSFALHIKLCLQNKLNKFVLQGNAVDKTAEHITQARYYRTCSPRGRSAAPRRARPRRLAACIYKNKRQKERWLGCVVERCRHYTCMHNNTIR